MSDQNVLDPIGGRVGGVGFGRLGGIGNPAGTSSGDDLDRLAAMLERIGIALTQLINLKPPLLNPELGSHLIEVWPEAQRELDFAVRRLRRETLIETRSYTYIIQRLRRAGLTGSMLRMKEFSLYHHLDPLGEAIRNYSSSSTPILTTLEDEGLIRRLLFYIKPGSKVMNSILGSVPAVVMPGKEIVKEVKEHVEAGYEARTLAQGIPNE